MPTYFHHRMLEGIELAVRSVRGLACQKVWK